MIYLIIFAIICYDLGKVFEKGPPRKQIPPVDKSTQTPELLEHSRILNRCYQQLAVATTDQERQHWINEITNTKNIINQIKKN